MDNSSFLESVIDHQNNHVKDWKTPLLNNLFTTVDELRNELKEKNNQINKLLIFQELLLTKINYNKIPHTPVSSINTPTFSSPIKSSQPNTSSSILSSAILSPDTSFVYSEDGSDKNKNDNVTVRKKKKPTTEIVEEKSEVQLNEVRSLKHNEYLTLNKCKKPNSTSFPWPKNTVLIASDSIFNNIEEHRLSNKLNVKVRCFSGATVDDMFDYILPLLRKKPDHIILHVGTNNATSSTPEEIMVKIENLVMYIKQFLPAVNITISSPTIRADNGKANLTVINLTSLIRNSSLDMLDNSNIHCEHLGKKGLHLNGQGTGRLAINTINLIRKL